MIGIRAYGVSVPYYRLARDRIYKAMGWFNPALGAMASGEKAVANCDEDSLTMAVAAGMDSFDGLRRSDIRALYLASTTLPYRERSNAAIALEALNLSENTTIAEFSGTVRAGTSALISALRAEHGGATLVTASDCRPAKASGAQEALFGDAAAAVVVSAEEVIAEFEGCRSVSADFADVRRTEGDQFVRVWEDRWIREEGYFPFILRAVKELLDEKGVGLQDVAKVIFPPWGGRDHGALAKKMGLKPEQVQDPLLGEIGNTGSAHPLLMLAQALDEARPGDRIIVAGYGSGADAILFQVTDAIESVERRDKVRSNLAYRADMDSYTKYLSFKGMLEREIGIRGEEIAPTSLSLSFRERKSVLRLTGGLCAECGTPQFPRESMCVNPQCGAIEQMEDYPFSYKPARLFTYTADHLTFSQDPPALYGIVDFDGGGRYWFDLTDCNLESLEVSQPLQMTFRRKYLDPARGVSGYFWKAMPFKGR